MVTNSTPSCFLKYSISLVVTGLAQNKLSKDLCDDSFDLPFVHHQHLRMPGDIGVDGDGEDELIVLPIAVIELIAPDILHVTGIDKPMTVGA